MQSTYEQLGPTAACSTWVKPCRCHAYGDIHRQKPSGKVKLATVQGRSWSVLTLMLLKRLKLGSSGRHLQKCFQACSN